MRDGAILAGRWRRRRSTFLIFALAALAFAGCRSAAQRVGPAPVIAIEPTAERVARGRYLADHLAACIDCHSPRDWSVFSGPPVEGREYSGGENMAKVVGRSGVVHAPNLTPKALDDWTDGELVRAMTEGVSTAMDVR